MKYSIDEAYLLKERFLYFGMDPRAAKLKESLDSYERFIKSRGSPVDGLTRREFDLLLVVGRAMRGGAPGLRPGEIVEALDITPPSLTPLLDRMEHYGLLARLPDPEDRRATIIAATPLGGSILGQSFGLLVEVYNEIADELGDDCTKLSELITRLTELIVKKRKAQISEGRFPLKTDYAIGAGGKVRPVALPGGFPGQPGFDPANLDSKVPAQNTDAPKRSFR